MTFVRFLFHIICKKAWYKVLLSLLPICLFSQQKKSPNMIWFSECNMPEDLILQLTLFLDYVQHEFTKAPHSSTLAWKIPWTEEPGRLQSMGSLRVGHNWATSLSIFTFMHWKRQWQPAPVFLPGESQGWGSLVGCRLWGRTESDTTKVT